MYSIHLNDIINEFQLEKIAGCDKIDDIMVASADINRPGLQLTGYLDYFGNDRIQIIGKVEMTYLESLSNQKRLSSLEVFFKQGFPCIVVSRAMEIIPELTLMSEKYCIPLLRSADITSRFMSGLIRYLNLHLAPRVTKHGVLVEVYGEGILILGESGVGKSEIALEIVKRGHRLVADDVVEVRKVSDKTLVGTAPEIIRHFIEIRGIGILDVKNLYGVGSVKMTESVNLIIQLEMWNNQKNYDRLGLIDEYVDILGIKVPSITIPVSPGRNLAVIVEVAALNHRQKKMGYNAAVVLNDRIISEINKSK